MAARTSVSYLGTWKLRPLCPGPEQPCLWERFPDVDQAGHFGFFFFFVRSVHRGDGALWQFAAALRVC